MVAGPLKEKLMERVEQPLSFFSVTYFLKCYRMVATDRFPDSVTKRMLCVALGKRPRMDFSIFSLLRNKTICCRSM